MASLRATIARAVRSSQTRSACIAAESSSSSRAERSTAQLCYHRGTGAMRKPKRPGCGTIEAKRPDQCAVS